MGWSINKENDWYCEVCYKYCAKEQKEIHAKKADVNWGPSCSCCRISLCQSCLEKALELIKQEHPQNG